ncbi:MAG: hypothetical protein OEW15_09875 [Nitrospirota bacterium]|nr:hypothetical protein [Nitrospirota bacterium]
MKAIFTQIDQENNTVKRTAGWLKEAYQGIGIKKLNDVPRDSFSSYASFLYKNQVYVIVHPGYFTFFQNTGDVPLGQVVEGMPILNVVERFTMDLKPEQQNLRIMREQERILRDFMEFMSRDKKLLIVVVPGDYRAHISVKGADAGDEYARFLNDLTNRSESVLYVESETWSNGFLAQRELNLFADFVNAVGAKRVVIGGGYIGMCLDNFYASIVKEKIPRSKASFALDLTTISPAMEVPSGIEVLDQSGRLDFAGVKKYFRSRGDTMLQDEAKRLRKNPFYDVYAHR